MFFFFHVLQNRQCCGQQPKEIKVQFSTKPPSSYEWLSFPSVLAERNSIAYSHVMESSDVRNILARFRAAFSYNRFEIMITTIILRHTTARRLCFTNNVKIKTFCHPVTSYQAFWTLILRWLSAAYKAFKTHCRQFQIMGLNFGNKLFGRNRPIPYVELDSLRTLKRQDYTH